MKPLLRKAVHFLVAGLFIQAAVAQSSCTNVVTVTSSGYSSPDSEGDIALRQAVAQALTAAVAQVNGAFMRHQTTLESRISTTITEHTYSDDVIEQFHETIDQVTAGFVTGFSVISENQDHGLTRVELNAGVCTDPRISIAFSGDSHATSAIEAAVLPFLQAGGWRASVDGWQSGDAAALIFATGATLHLHIDSRLAVTNEYRGLQHTMLEVTGNFTDLASNERSQSYAITVEGVGVNLAGAKQDAGSRAAHELVNIFQQTWALADPVSASGLAPGHSEQSTRLRFTGVTLANTKFEIQDLLSHIPGITMSVPLDWDAESHVLQATVHLIGDPCHISSMLEASRRILIQTQECRPGAIILDVRRE